MPKFKHKPANKQRAKRILKALRTQYHDTDKKATITDALADLRHLCDVNGLDFAELDRVAYDHYTTEIYEGIRQDIRRAIEEGQCD